MKLAVIGLCLLAIQAYAGTTVATSPGAPMIQEEPRYPLAGTFFSGSPDALVKLRDFAGQKGFALEIVTLPDGSQRLSVTSALLANKAFVDVFNEAGSGRLGKFQFSIVSGPAPAP